MGDSGRKFEKLIEIMATLRGPNGCPWDKEQDFDSLKPMLVEEVYEVIEAIDDRDFNGLAEELGDVMLHIVFQAQLGKEGAQFDIDVVIEKISEKLIRRHPHVFGNESASTSGEVIKNWEAIKAKEKSDRRSLMDGIPGKLPAILEAQQISERAARAGFDWANVDGIFDKLQEEIRELHGAIDDSPDISRRSHIEDEVGDILFTAVNIARYLKVDAESALKRSNRKFKARFRSMESELERNGKAVGDSNSAELNELWEKAKSGNP